MFINKIFSAMTARPVPEKAAKPDTPLLFVLGSSNNKTADVFTLTRDAMLDCKTCSGGGKDH